MEQGTSRARQGGRGVVATIVLALVLGGALTGGLYWWSTRPATQAVPPAAPTAVADTATPTVPPAEAASRAEAALQDQRMFAPPRDNAFELYLHVAAAEPGNLQARNAIADLFPYALLYIEERIAAGDLADAERMYGLMQRADADAPALPRLAAALDVLRSDQAQREAAALASAAPPVASQPVAAASVATSPVNDAATPPPAAANTAATALAARPPVAATTARTTTAPAPVATTPAPVAAAAPPQETPTRPIAANADGLPQVVSSAQAQYPARAMRRKLEGRVELAFTVLPDGSVADVEVVQSEPEGVFDREAVAAMKRWRFAQTTTASQGRRVFDFRLN